MLGHENVYAYMLCSGHSWSVTPGGGVGLQWGGVAMCCVCDGKGVVEGQSMVGFRDVCNADLFGG